MSFRDSELPPMPAQAHAAPHLRLPLVSVVVPTHRQRPALLQRCLQALLRQSMDPDAFEIIVVDDAHSNATCEQVETLAQREGAGPLLRYLRPAGTRGVAAARNCGWKAARAPLVAFTDDDTVPTPDWLARGERAMHSGPWAAVGGRVVVPHDGAARPTDRERTARGRAHAEFAAANAFVRRAALRQVHGFDERFKRAGREDCDLRFRLEHWVGPVGRCDEAIVLHPVGHEPWGVCLREQRNVFFDALLYRKHHRLERERVRQRPPWKHYAIVGLTALAAALALAGMPTVAAIAAALALALVLQFALQRLRGASLAPMHVLEMLLTSAVIPFLSVYWRLRGAVHFRVWFL